MKTNIKQLTLSKETVKTLNQTQMAQVAGGSNLMSQYRCRTASLPTF